MSRVGRGQMIEIVRFGAHHYGLEASHVERGFESEKDVVLTCEPFGMRQIAEWSAKNGVRHIPVYVNNPSEIIAERFPKRFGFDIAEAMIHRDPQAAADVLKGYARRLSEML